MGSAKCLVFTLYSVGFLSEVVLGFVVRLVWSYPELILGLCKFLHEDAPQQSCAETSNSLSSDGCRWNAIHHHMALCNHHPVYWFCLHTMAMLCTEEAPCDVCVHLWWADLQSLADPLEEYLYSVGEAGLASPFRPLKCEPLVAVSTANAAMPIDMVKLQCPWEQLFEPRQIYGEVVAGSLLL